MNDKDSKKTRIILIPDDRKIVRQFSLPRVSPVFLIGLMLAVCIVLGWGMSRYHILKRQMLKMVALQAENDQQRRRLFQLAENLGRLTARIKGFETYNMKLRELGIYPMTDDSSFIPGIGGSTSCALDQDHSADRVHRNLVRLMHESLEDMNKRIHSARNNLMVEPEFAQNREETVTETGPLFITDSENVFTRKEIRKQIREIAMEYDLDPNLALGMASVESGYNHLLVSPKGAVGVMQVMPKFAWHDFRIDREMLFDPHINIRIGLSWMKSLLERFDDDLDLSLAAYNAGASRVVRAGYSVPPIKETQNFVEKVKRAMEKEAS